MQYFTEQGLSHKETLDKIRMKHGDNAKILTHRSVRMGGFLGFFTREGVEMTGYISENPVKARKLDLEEEKRKILATVKGDQTLQQVLKEVQDIKERISNGGTPSAEHPCIAKIEDLLARNDFTLPFIREMTERLKRELSYEELDDFNALRSRISEWIAESIIVSDERWEKKPKVMILVGPTGVGKTTTIAKLAAVFAIGGKGRKPLNVRMITIDNYRIGAKKQIETYGEIMGIPVACVETYQDLEKKLMLFQDSDVILIDAIGKSPNDSRKLAEMKEMLDAAGGEADVYLAVSATTKASDLEEIMRQFEPFRYRSIVLTKLDETVKIGNIVSVLASGRKPLAYYAVGQVVPQDIEEASAERLLEKLEGFQFGGDRGLRRSEEPVNEAMTEILQARGGKLR